MVSVSDTGVGLPTQHVDQIFDPFFTTNPHGTGMGLRISRSIVEYHGSRLWVVDKSPPGAIFVSLCLLKAKHINKPPASVLVFFVHDRISAPYAKA
jgi:nitrogen fixation/metabolism regulation signal transduction histidine kinase